MKYLVIGVGGTGGGLGGFLAHNHKDVTFLVRDNSQTKAALEKDGLVLHSTILGDIAVKDIKTATAQTVAPMDVIFVCVKGYSLEDIIPAIQKASHKDTVVIPILNIFGTGSKLQQALPHIHVLDGCIYIAAYQQSPGVICQQGELMRVVFGERDGKNAHPYLPQIVEDLSQSRIETILSAQIVKDTFQKFTLISTMAAAGAYYDATAWELIQPGEANDMLLQLIQEILALGDAIGIQLSGNVTENIIETVRKMAPDTTSSLQKDIKKGGQSEMDGLVFEVYRLGQKYNIPMPGYEKITEKFQ